LVPPPRVPGQPRAPPPHAGVPGRDPPQHWGVGVGGPGGGGLLEAEPPGARLAGGVLASRQDERGEERDRTPGEPAPHGTGSGARARRTRTWTSRTRSRSRVISISWSSTSQQVTRATHGRIGRRWGAT